MFEQKCVLSVWLWMGRKKSVEWKLFCGIVQFSWTMNFGLWTVSTPIFNTTRKKREKKKTARDSRHILLTETVQKEKKITQKRLLAKEKASIEEIATTKKKHRNFNVECSKHAFSSHFSKMCSSAKEKSDLCEESHLNRAFTVRRSDFLQIELSNGQNVSIFFATSK